MLVVEMSFIEEKEKKFSFIAYATRDGVLKKIFYHYAHLYKDMCMLFLLRYTCHFCSTCMHMRATHIYSNNKPNE